jgi:hypothetical protein
VCTKYVQNRDEEVPNNCLLLDVRHSYPVQEHETHVLIRCEFSKQLSDTLTRFVAVVRFLFFSTSEFWFRCCNC